MNPKVKFPVPEGFSKLVNAALARQPKLALREVARRTEISPSYLVRILAGERGLPENEILLKMAQALGITPPEQLLIEAGRIPNTRQRVLLRSLTQLSPADMDKVLRLARKLEADGK